jgi:2-keto-4-pentenoate hydratase/2-oxohepta-3-ene-1,7-dioic acid hydratase in catechol pathway
MKLCRFEDGRFEDGHGRARLGLVEDSGPAAPVRDISVRDVTSALDYLPVWTYPFPSYDLLIAHLDAVADRIRAIAPSSPSVPLAGLKLLSPVANPGKIVAAPVNYQKHLDEVKDNIQLHQNNPAHTASIHNIGLFLKASSSLAGPGEGIALRKLDRRNDHEVELAFVIGKKASNVSRAEALDYVAGYAIGLDITIRGAEDRSFRKSPDSYTVLGPWLVTKDEIPDPSDLDLSIAVNGETRQQSNTKYMILGVAELIEFASSFYTLHPGDIVITGTPEGVSPIVPGDVVVACIEMIGSMEVKVRAAS